MKSHAMKKMTGIALGVGMTMALLSGCANQTSVNGQSDGQTAMNSVKENTSGSLSIPNNRGSHKNGTPVSLKLLISASFPTEIQQGEKMYSLFYMSEGKKVQGYLIVPPGKGPFPLLLSLHGSSIIPIPKPNHNDNFGWTATYAADDAANGCIEFFPNYVGYGASAGEVEAPYHNFLDTMNGLMALEQIQGLHIKKNDLYISGASMGGYVAMMVAEHDPQVKAVALKSPFPGAITTLSWLMAQVPYKLSADDSNDLAIMEGAEGIDFHSKWYQENSFSYKVHFPILIEGGTKDPIFPPPLLRVMYKHLVKYDSHVKLEFFPGGHVPRGYVSTGAWLDFFSNHGLDLAFS